VLSGLGALAAPAEVWVLACVVALLLAAAGAALALARQRERDDTPEGRRARRGHRQVMARWHEVAERRRAAERADDEADELG
jgi:hypothetical protein